MSEEIENSVWELMNDLAIPHGRLRALVERLESDFDADEGGYRQMRALKDEECRAVVSDQIAQSARAMRDNLIEARLHQGQLEGVVGADGVRYPDRANQKDTIRRGAEMDMAITGCVRALGSALDCLAATAIGTLRMPFPVQRASFNQIAKPLEPKQLAKGTAKQKKLWTEITKLSELHRQKPPAGWLDWLTGMRNLNVHRARQVHILLQRLRASGQPQMIVFAADPVEVTKRSARFDLHLRRRPQLPDMQDFITSPTTGDLWINERATTTLPGMLIMAADLIEEAAQFLLAWWEYAAKWPALFPPPEKVWALEQPPWPSFDGVSPSATPFPADLGVVGPHMTERLRLAERLRQARDS